jgi:multidrug efflux pump subunit AcrA (membrane-fusion protein)
MRGIFPNPDHFLTPGLFARIRLPIGKPHKAVLVAEQALGRDQGQKYLYVVKKVAKGKDKGRESEKEEYEDKVEYRAVKVGRLYDGLREVTDGLTVERHPEGNVMGERVIVTGMQRVRDGAVVEARKVDMPMPPHPPGGEGAAQKDEQ